MSDVAQPSSVVRQNGFPLRLFAAAIVVSLAAALVGAGLQWRMQARLGEFEARQDQLSEYRSKVMLYDEALTMSARMAAATGDAAYRERYDRFDVELDKLLKETAGAIHRPEVRQFIEQTDDANRRLVEIERRALDLASSGRRDEASALLVSDDYMRLKQLYADGVEKIVAWGNDDVANEQRRLRLQSIVAQAAAGVTVLALLSIWYFAFHAGRRWARERVQSEVALRQAREELEQKVEARTRDLRIANHALQVRETSLAFTNSILSAATEGSPDAVLSVDHQGRIISFNQHFLDLWQVPPHLVVRGNMSKPVRLAAASHVKDSASFVARIEYLYEHPDEVGHDRLELKDGRIVEQDTRSLRGQDNEYLGRIWFFRDVTERERAIQQLRESETQFRAIFDNAGEGIALIEFASKALIAGNGRFCAMLGYSPGELAKLGVADIHPPEAAIYVMEQFERYAGGGPHTYADIPIKRQNGSVFFADINSASVDIGGKKCVLAIFRDTTERRRAEQATKDMLRRARAQLETVGKVGQAEALLLGEVEKLAWEITELAARAAGCERVNVWLFNEAETELHCVDLYEATPGKHSKGLVLSEREFGHELRIVKAEKYVNADDALTDPRVSGYVESYLKPLRITSMLDVAIQASGRTFGLLCLEHVDKPHHWEPDEIAFALQLADKIGLAVISRQRREAEEAVRRNEEKYRNLVESTTDYIWETDEEGNYTYVSPAVSPLLGYQSTEMIGKSPFAFMDPEEAERVGASFAPIAAAHQPFAQLENTVRGKDGRQIVLETSGVPIFDKNGTFRGYRGIDRNVTRRKEAELALRQRDAPVHAAASPARSTSR